MAVMKMIFVFLLNVLPSLVLGACDGDGGKMEARVIGGESINIEKAPFMALLRPNKDSHFCGASIVTELFLVSAAHCIVENLKLEVTVGTDNALKGGQRYEVDKTFKHPNYDDTPFNNDIAMVRVKNKIKFNDRVRPIRLAEPDIFIPDNAVFQILGFGVTEAGVSSNQLMSAKLPYVSPTTCKKIFGDITEQMICAGHKDKSGCFTDSGGPLVYKNKLIGAVSFGTLKCNKATVFARISALRGFIDETIASYSY